MYFDKTEILGIEIRGMNTRGYFDSACEIHVKHAVNKEWSQPQFEIHRLG